MTLEDIMALHGDPAAMREAIIAYGKEWREAGAAAERDACALLALNFCLVPPDGGSPTEDERLLCYDIAAAIRARAQEEKT